MVWHGLCTMSGLQYVLAANLCLANCHITNLRLQYDALQVDLAQEVTLQPMTWLTSEVDPPLCVGKRTMVAVHSYCIPGVLLEIAALH